MSDYYNDIHLDFTKYSVRQAIEYSFNRRILILLWTIHPDIAIYSVCLAIREKYRKTKEELPFPDDEIEDRVGKELVDMVCELWLTKNEMKLFLVMIEKRMLSLVANNNAQKALDEMDKIQW